VKRVLKAVTACIRRQLVDRSPFDRCPDVLAGACGGSCLTALTETILGFKGPVCLFRVPGVFYVFMLLFAV
jgi:hypothetical protein